MTLQARIRIRLPKQPRGNGPCLANALWPSSFWMANGWPNCLARAPFWSLSSEWPSTPWQDTSHSHLAGDWPITLAGVGPSRLAGHWPFRQLATHFWTRLVVYFWLEVDQLCFTNHKPLYFGQRLAIYRIVYCDSTRFSKFQNKKKP